MYANLNDIHVGIGIQNSTIAFMFDLTNVSKILHLEWFFMLYSYNKNVEKSQRFDRNQSATTD